MTFEQWIQTDDGQAAMRWLSMPGIDVREDALRLAFTWGETAGELDAHERFERIIGKPASEPSTQILSCTGKGS